MKLIGRNIVQLTQNSPSKILTEKVQKFCKDLELSGEDFLNDFGGFFYLVETEEDLKEIPTTVIINDKYSNLKDSASAFDIFERLDDNFYHVLMVTNNSGGNTYIVPISIVENNPNALKSRDLTTEDYWESNL